MTIGQVFAAALLAALATTQAMAQDDRELPPGPNLELVQNNCTGCHSTGMILTQPKLSKATWTAEVTKMRTVYKAPVDDADVEPIVAYLTAMPVPK